MDVDAIMTTARGAQVTVYDAPFNGIRTSFQTLFNRMIGDGVNVISNSWVYCEDQTSAADAQCVDGSGQTISVPADSPHATAVGGTSLTTGPAFTYGSESFWNGLNQTPPTGAGGFGVSRFFSRPAYQDGFNSLPLRSVPDISIEADPAKGVAICQADAGGCPTGASYGGTSLSAPIWAAFVAILNQAQGQNLGELNPKLYPLGNTDAFHTAASMGSDFQHVGLGSPKLNLIYRALTGKTVGAVDPTVSENTADSSVALADGNAQAFVVVRLQDADGQPVSGKTVTLAAGAGSHATVTPASGVSDVNNGAVIFSIKDTVPEILTFTATDTTDSIILNTKATVAFVSPPAAAGGISATPTTVNANGSDSTTITVTLQDAKGNPSPNKLVSISQGDGSSVISTSSAVTDATGKAQFTAVSAKAETVTYTATDVTDQNLPVPGSATVNFVNASGFCAQFGRYGIGQAAPGYAVTTFAGNFQNDCFTGVGPISIAFDQNGTLFVGDITNNNLYAFGQQGGTAGPATLVGHVSTSPSGLDGMAFTSDGRLYANFTNSPSPVEVNPATGEVIRVVVNMNSPNLGLAVDPLSGDLFVSVGNGGGINRVSNFANGPGTVTAYVAGNFDGLTFAPDGTLYAADEFGGGIYRVPGTNTPQPRAATLITTLAGHPDGIALDINPANPSKPILYVNRNDGTITRIDTSLLPADGTAPCGGACTDIYTGGTFGDFVAVSPAGCLYATQSDRIIKITNADGTCSLTPASTVPQIVLSPENIQPSPAQGTGVTFTATLKNVANPEDTPVTLFVSGANPIARLVRADKNGNAVFTYTGVGTGADQLFASADVGSTTITSNTAQVTWTPGKHSTFLTLNLSPSSGTPNKPLTVSATLVDVSATPTPTPANGNSTPAPVVGATVNFTLAGQTCQDTTDATGTATCSVTPSAAAGIYKLDANFAGTSNLLPSSASKTVDLVDAPAAVANTVQFDSATYNVTEGCASLTVNVTRSGDTSQAASVDYATSDGTASERKDYTTALGTLHFAPGETQKSIDLLVTEDSFVEGTESFNVMLSNPSTGLTLGTPFVATVQIADAPPGPLANVIDDAGAFVCQHYHDFLDRQGDSSGLQFWTQNITSCGTNAQCVAVHRVSTSAAFFLSIEFKETGYLVIRAHKAAFGNAESTPRYATFLKDQHEVNAGVIVGQGNWQQQIETNKQNYLLDFVSRPEFVAQFPQGMTASAYVDKLFANAGATPSTDERSAAITAYGAGDAAGRAAALRSVVESDSVFNAEYNPAFVLMQYFGYLRRNPDSTPDNNFGGYEFWLAKLNSLSRAGEDMRDDSQAQARVTRAEMVRAFIESTEYRQRFGP